jgi:hypothetical protein
MNTPNTPGDRISANIKGTISGQVAVGKQISQTQSTATPGKLDPQALSILEAPLEEDGSSQTMSGQIFISYRREESRWSARSLHDRLCRHFDPTQIFMDIDAIALGEDFVEAIETTVAKCDVLIAVIGKNWLTSKDDHGNRRLDNPKDFVRIEIETALKRKIRVIPVLVDGALMPGEGDIPGDLKPLVRRNALMITDTSFDGDCQRLAAAIRLVLEKAAAEERKRLATEQPQQRERQEKERLERKRQQEEQAGLRAEQQLSSALSCAVQRAR